MGAKAACVRGAPPYIPDAPWGLLPVSTEPEGGLLRGLVTGPEDRAGGACCPGGGSADTDAQGCNITKRSILWSEPAGQ